MKITRADRVAVLLILAEIAVIATGTIAFLSLARLNLPDWQLGTLTLFILLGMVLLAERLTLWLLTWRGYLCPSCRSRSVARDVERVVRGHRCSCRVEPAPPAAKAEVQ
jgi:hypothetical protein